MPLGTLDHMIIKGKVQHGALYYYQIDILQSHISADCLTSSQKLTFRVVGSFLDYLFCFSYNLIIVKMNRRPANHSTQRAVEDRRHPKINYERKCVTPSGQHHSTKKSKSKPKDADKKQYHNTKHNKHLQIHIPQSHNTVKRDSPFRHKNRPLTNLNNVRHARNLEHQLSHLHESAAYDSILEESGKKNKAETVTHKAIAQGKKLMKNNQFEKGFILFSEATQRDPNSLQAQYLLGVCAFHLEHHDEAIKYFTGLLGQDPQFRKNAYLFLAISLKKKQHNQDALLTLTEALQFYPKYFDALILRAKILSKLHRYYDALEDLNKTLKLDPGNPQSLLAKADCLRALSQHVDAIKIYTQILEAGWDSEVVLKRAIGHIENNCPNEALLDLNRLIQRTPNNSEAYLFKGLAFSKMKNYNEAILAYEQAIKFNSSKKATTKALYEVSKLKIELGDYYGASYTLERAGTLDVDQKVIEKLRIFTEGSTAIMKKKYKRGIQNLNYLARKEHLSQQIRPLIYSFRAYAHFCQCKFVNALNDLHALQKLGFSCDPASEYNLKLLTGIFHSQNNDFSQAMDSFQEAQQLRRQFSDPIIYKALTKIGQYNRNPKTKDLTLLQQALQLMTVSLLQQDHYNSHYICAAIEYGLENPKVALEHIEKAIETSDDHVVKHFYLRGLINGILGKTKEAFVDFSNVLSLGKELKEKSESEDGEKEKQILEAYLNRAKCHLLFGQKKKAFQDLQTYISFKPLDSQIHTVAGKLLFSIGACEDAIKAYNYSPNIDKKKQELLERAKCYLVLKQLNFCLRDLEKAVEAGDSLSRFDYCCLSALKEASKGTTENFREAVRKLSPAEGLTVQKGHIFSFADFYFYKGVFSFYLQQYPQAHKLFCKSKNLKALNSELQYLEESDPEKFVGEFFQNKVYTDAEIDYNIALSDLMCGNKENARKTLAKYESFQLLYGQDDPKQPLDLTPFPVANRLCSIFPEVQYPQNNFIRFRLSFCLPTVHPPQINFQIENKIIQELGMSSTDPRPDAPWIKRNSFGVIFTDEIVGVDIDIKTEKSVKRLDQIKIQVEHHSPEESPVIDKSKLKDMFALDAGVEDRLARLMNKKKV